MTTYVCEELIPSFIPQVKKWTNGSYAFILENSAQTIIVLSYYKKTNLLYVGGPTGCFQGQARTWFFDPKC
jgi:hypothetical protein